MSEKEASELMRLSGQIGTYISFLPLIYGFIKIQIFRKPPYLYLLSYFMLGALLNWATSAFVEYATKHYDEIKGVLTKWEIDDTFFVDPLYFLRNIIFLGAFTYFSIADQRLKRLVMYVSIALGFFVIWNSFWGETYKDYQAVGSTLDNLYKILLGGSIMYWIFQSTTSRVLWKKPHYWFAMAIIVIGAISGLIDLLSNSMFKQTSVVFYQVHTLKNVFMMLAFVMFTIGVHFVKPSLKRF